MYIPKTFTCLIVHDDASWSKTVKIINYHTFGKFLSNFFFNITNLYKFCFSEKVKIELFGIGPIADENRGIPLPPPSAPARLCCCFGS